MSTIRKNDRRASGCPELREALKACRGAFIGVAVLSGALNVLFLTGSFYMLEVYDRVLPSGSVPTLVGLAVIATLLYAFQGAIDIVRSRILARIGISIGEAVSLRTFHAVSRLPLATDGIDSTQPARDMDTVRGFLSGLGPTALFDLPWMPFYLTICFAFHSWIGWTATVGGLLLFAMTYATEVLSQKPVRETSQLARQRNALSETVKRNAEVTKAMGMEPRLGKAWGDLDLALSSTQKGAADVTGALGSVSKVMRMLLQSAVLTVGAYLVINHEATGGIIIASSILTSRALAPIEMAIGQWKSFVGARQAWSRLESVLQRLPPEAVHLDLPAPAAYISVEKIAVTAPGGRIPLIQDVTFGANAGEGIGIVGPSGSGKSTLARALVGAWSPVHGNVRLDGASLEQWPSEKLGVHVGYLPQDVQLFPGSVAHNIARFDADATSESIVAAATAARVHDLIVRLPNGYDTPVGEGGAALSAGQRQRIGLARALFGNPFLVVLDEPNSNLDSQGEDALTEALMGVRERGGIVVVVAHRPSALAAMSLVLLMGEGRVQAFGPKDDVLRQIMAPAEQPVSLPRAPGARSIESGPTLARGGAIAASAA